MRAPGSHSLGLVALHDFLVRCRFSDTMSCRGSRQMKTKYFLLLAAALLVAQAGCGSRAVPAESKMYKMGERAEVGPLIYTVLDVEWKDSLGESLEPRMPQHHFLLVRVSITNSGGARAGIPPMLLADASGATFTELSDGKDCEDWLGYLRTIKPAETLHGRVLFDVPTAPYKLKLIEDTSPDEARVAIVDLPLQFQAPDSPWRK